MQVRDGMSKVVLTVGPGHSLREAARLMAERRVGAAVVLDPDSPGPGESGSMTTAAPTLRSAISRAASRSVWPGPIVRTSVVMPSRTCTGTSWSDRGDRLNVNQIGHPADRP